MRCCGCLGKRLLSEEAHHMTGVMLPVNVASACLRDTTSREPVAQASTDVAG